MGTSLCCSTLKAITTVLTQAHFKTNSQKNKSSRKTQRLCGEKHGRLPEKEHDREAGHGDVAVLQQVEARLRHGLQELQHVPSKRGLESGGVDCQ